MKHPLSEPSDGDESMSMDDLLNDVEWLRRLAARLARSEAEADDLTQRTWLAALRWRGRRGHGAVAAQRGWLFGILRNEARMTGREEARRRDVEQDAAIDGPGPEPSAAEWVGEEEERLALQRTVLDAVGGLEGDQRRVIVLRYLEGLSVAEIARRIGAPPRTVETRLRRGRERLRLRLDGVHGSRRAWIPLALPLLDRPAAATAAAAVPASLSVLLAMKIKTVALLAIAAAAILTGLYLAQPKGANEDGPATTVRKSPALAGAVQPVAPESLTGSNQRDSAVEATPEPSGTPDAPEVPEVMIEGYVFGEDGAPLANVPVRWRMSGLGSAPLEAAENEGTQAASLTGVAMSDAKGRIQVPFRGQGVRLAPERPGDVALIWRGLRADHETEALAPFILLASRTTFIARVVDEDGTPIAGSSCAIELPEDFMSRVGIAVSMSDSVDWSATSEPTGRVEIEGVPASGDAKLEVSAAGFITRTWDNLPGLAERSATTAAVDLVLERVPENRRVRGVVLGPSGDPVEDAIVTLGLEKLRTGSDGTFEFTIDPEFEATRGRQSLMAAAEGLQPAVQRPARGGGPKAWPDWVELRLSAPTLTIEGVVLSPSGEPAVGAEVWVADPTVLGSVDGVRFTIFENMGAGARGWWVTHKTDAEGRFRIPHLDGRDYEVRAIQRETLLEAEPVEVAAGSADVELQLAKGTAVVPLNVEIVDVRGRPVAGARARLNRVTLWITDASKSMALSKGVETELVDAGENGLCALGRVAIADGTELQIYAAGYTPLRTEISALEIEVRGESHVARCVLSSRCEVRIMDESPEGERATWFSLEDSAGKELELTFPMENGFMRGPGGEIVDGRSAVFRVSGAAATLKLSRKGELLEARSIVLSPEGLNVLKR